MDLSTLFEMDWYDRSPLTAVLRRNRGRWIHFTRGAPNRDSRTAPTVPEPERPSGYSPRGMKAYQRALGRVQRQNATAPVPKLGVNPKSMWRDPKGIYFYPVNFLLSGHERILSGNQYALDQPYYYIADINLNDANGVNLGTMTWDDVEAIAKRNGWFDQMQEFRKLPPNEQKDALFHYARPDLPGGFFWHFIDRMVKDGKISWNKAFKGVSYIRDPNLSIIHSNEPDQVLVLDPRLIKVVDSGQNKAPVKAGGSSDDMSQWMHALLSVIKRMRGEYGGDLTWMNKIPSLRFHKGSGEFVLAIPERSGRMEVGLTLNIKYGRAEEQTYIRYDDLIKQDIEQIVETLRRKVEQVATRKTDLLFRPIMPLPRAERMMQTEMTDRPNMTIKTIIYNSDDPKWSSVSMHGEAQREQDRLTLRTTCYLSLKSDEISGSVGFYAGSQHLISAQSDYGESITEPEALHANIAAKVRENFTNFANYFAPKETSGYDRNARFRTPEEFTAFKGWVARNCGLSLGGQIEQVLADEISAYEAYPKQKALIDEISYVLRSRY